MDEYVPITTPKIKAKAKFLISSPPRKYSENNTNRVVKEVIKDHPNV